MDTLYLSMDEVPAQLPGLQMERGKREAIRRRDDGREKLVSRRREKHKRKKTLLH